MTSTGLSWVKESSSQHDRSKVLDELIHVHVPGMNNVARTDKKLQPMLNSTE